KVDLAQLRHLARPPEASWPLEPGAGKPELRSRLWEHARSQALWTLAAVGTTWVCACPQSQLASQLGGTIAWLGALRLLPGLWPRLGVTAVWLLTSFNKALVGRYLVSSACLIYSWLALTLADDARQRDVAWGLRIFRIVDVLPLWKFGFFISTALLRHLPFAGIIFGGILGAATAGGLAAAAGRGRLLAWPVVFLLGIGHQLQVDCRGWMHWETWRSHASQLLAALRCLCTRPSTQEWTSYERRTPTEPEEKRCDCGEVPQLWLGHKVLCGSCAATLACSSRDQAAAFLEGVDEGEVLEPQPKRARRKADQYLDRMQILPQPADPAEIQKLEHWWWYHHTGEEIHELPDEGQRGSLGAVEGRMEAQRYIGTPSAGDDRTQDLGSPIAQVTVQSMAGTATELSISELCRVREIKQQVWRAGGPEVPQQQLLLGLRLLEDTETALDAGIVDGSVLQLACMPDVKFLGNRMRGVARCRPWNWSEKDSCRKAAVVDPEKKQVVVEGRPGIQYKETFTFDAVYDETCSQQQVFDGVGKEVMDTFLEGYSCTIIAAGQSGSGKSHTMFGPVGFDSEGLAPRCFRRLFEAVRSVPHWTVSLSFLEIRDEKLYDMLSESGQEVKLQHHTLNPFVPDTTVIRVESLQELDRVYRFGLMGSGAKNSKDTIGVAQQRERGKDTIITVALETQDGTGRECLRSLTLADCQGFGDRRRSDGDHAILQLRRNRQAAKTLRAISDVFDAITSSRLVPHRHSMFTDLLKESLGGSTVTYWIANFSTADACLNETMVTLQLVSAAQGVENEAPCMDLQDIFEPVRPAKEFALKDVPWLRGRSMLS
ncbi:unnamed protein product, partial [Effrenium voratum]